jgi:hypothetical protein
MEKYKLAQPSKDYVNEPSSISVNNNEECRRISRNNNRHVISDSSEYMYDDPLVSAMESSSYGVSIDCQEHGNSVAIADFLPRTDVGCVGKTLKGIVYSQKLDQVGKLISKNHDLQEDVTIRRSTRSKKHLTSKKQDFLW